MSASSLYRTKTKSSTSIELVTTDPEYKKKLASVVYYMVKNMLTIVIKQGGSGTAINALYANIFRVLDEGYIKQNFYDTEIGGTIINKHIDKNKQWIDSEFFSNLKDDYSDKKQGAFTLENAYAIWLFSDSDKFDEVFAKFFSDAAAMDNKYPQLRPSDIV
jgi:AAA15 family ATPase/GTPase